MSDNMSDDMSDGTSAAKHDYGYAVLVPKMGMYSKFRLSDVACTPDVPPSEYQRTEIQPQRLQASFDDPEELERHNIANGLKPLVDMKALDGVFMGRVREGEVAEHEHDKKAIGAAVARASGSAESEGAPADGGITESGSGKASKSAMKGTWANSSGDEAGVQRVQASVKKVKDAATDSEGERGGESESDVDESDGDVPQPQPPQRRRTPGRPLARKEPNVGGSETMSESDGGREHFFDYDWPGPDGY